MLARQLAKRGRLEIDFDGRRVGVDIPKSDAGLLALVDGGRNLGEIAQGAGLDPFAFNAAWGRIERGLVPLGVMLYSHFLR